jgi:hypothetical protein
MGLARKDWSLQNFGNSVPERQDQNRSFVYFCCAVRLRIVICVERNLEIFAPRRTGGRRLGDVDTLCAWEGAGR